jgi:hypothetical protein
MTAQDLSVVDRLLGQFEREAGGSHNRMCDAAQQIALEGGMPDAEGLIRAMAANPDGFDELAQRPWTRLLGVATEASERGDSLLVARICWFAHFYCDQFIKTLSRADVGWVNLFEANSAIRAAIAALGLGQFSALQPEEVGVYRLNWCWSAVADRCDGVRHRCAYARSFGFIREPRHPSPR